MSGRPTPVSLDLRLLAKSTALVGATGCVGLLVIGLITDTVGPSPQRASAPPAPVQQQTPAAVPIVKTAPSQAATAVSYSGPPEHRTAAEQSLNALFAACPDLREAMGRATQIALSWWGAPIGNTFQAWFGWHHMVIVEADLPDEVMQAEPAFFRDPQWGNHIMIRLGGGLHPGADLDWPTELALCDMDDELGPAFIAGFTRTWHQRNILKPIPALQLLEPAKTPPRAS